MTVTLLAIAAAIAVDDAGRRLAALVALALKRADVTQDYVSLVTGIPRNKLSEQLAGKVPFTGLCRILANRALKDETDFWFELTAIFADQVNRAVVSIDLGHIVSKLEEIVGAPKRMARMDLPNELEQRERA